MDIFIHHDKKRWLHYWMKKIKVRTDQQEIMKMNDVGKKKKPR